MIELPFDLQSAHKYFSMYCFNRAWELMEKTEWSEADRKEMVQLATASLWHWTQRSDCAPNNLFGGHWQLSRIYSLIGDANQARIHGELALKHGTEAGPYHEGYAHEALARAETVAGNSVKRSEHLEKARKLAELIKDEKIRGQLLSDLTKC